MKGILADVNIEGYVDHLAAIMQAEPWKLFWDHFQLHYYRFRDVALRPETVDLVVWDTCQEKGLFLITDNRNESAPDSLEGTIRSKNTKTSLPVFTIGDVRRLLRDRAYAEKVVESFFVYLLQEDNILGTGRLFLP